jgi:hypothetical protein
MKFKKVVYLGACGTYGEKRNIYRALVRNPQVKRLLERLGRRWG